MIKHVYFFKNGNVITFDARDEQVSMLTGPFERIREPLIAAVKSCRPWIHGEIWWGGIKWGSIKLDTSKNYAPGVELEAC